MHHPIYMVLAAYLLNNLHVRVVLIWEIFLCLKSSNCCILWRFFYSVHLLGFCFFFRHYTYFPWSCMQIKASIKLDSRFNHLQQLFLRNFRGRQSVDLSERIHSMYHQLQLVHRLFSSRKQELLKYFSIFYLLSSSSFFLLPTLIKYCQYVIYTYIQVLLIIFLIISVYFFSIFFDFFRFFLIFSNFFKKNF